MFRLNKLTPKKVKPTLKKFSVIDIETEKWHGDNLIEPFLLVYYDGVSEPKTWTGPYCVRDFFVNEFLTYKHRGEICYGHNGGGFDFLPFMNTLLWHNHDIEKKLKTTIHPRLIIPSSGSLLQIAIRDGKKHTWYLRDSFSLFAYSLDKLTQGFKVPHVKWSKEKKEALMRKPFEENQEEWMTYCSNDAVGLYECIAEFKRIIESLGSSVQLTTPMTSLELFRCRYLKEDLPNYRPYEHNIREAYFGGRTEIFNLWANPEYAPYYYYDVKGMYMSVMRDSIFPVGTPHYVKITDPADFKDQCGYAFCHVDAPDLYIPVLPFREKMNNNKLLFPVGSWEGWYDFAHLSKAFDMGYKIRVQKAYLFNKVDYLFKDYMNDMWNIRREAQKGALGETAKLMGNSLYGKFVQHRERDEVIIGHPIESDMKDMRLYDEELDIWLKKGETRAGHILPGIGCRVTALSQCVLYDQMQKAHEQGAVVNYCDTDSIMTNAKLPHSDRTLGMLDIKLEFTEGIFLFPKTYAWLDKDGKFGMRYKGVPMVDFEGNRLCEMEWQDFVDALHDGDMTNFSHRFDGPLKFKTALKRANELCDQNVFRSGWKTKSIKSFFDKREVLPDYDTRPLTMPIVYPPKRYELKPSHLDYSKKEKRRRLMAPQSMSERGMVERIHRSHHVGKEVIMRCLSICRDYDFDLEHEVDWDVGDYEHQIRRKLGLTTMDDYDKYMNYIG